MSTSTPGIRLFREIVRSVRKLPQKNMKTYYLNIAREKLAAHREEDDQERIRMMVDRSFTDVKWVLKKYGVDSK